MCVGYAQCPKGLNISYIRHDHLLSNRGKPFGADPGSSCDLWVALLPQYPTVVLSFGAHLKELGPKMMDRTFHKDRTVRLAHILEKTPRAVFVKATWGFTHFTKDETLVNEIDPANGNAPIDHQYNWQNIPAISDMMAGVLTSYNVSIVDPTTAIRQRHDCHIDHLHTQSMLLLRSTWPMLLHVLNNTGDRAPRWRPG